MKINMEYEIEGIQHSTGFLNKVNVKNIALQIGSQIDGNEFIVRDTVLHLIRQLRAIANEGNEFAEISLKEIIHNLYGEFQKEM